VRYKGENISSKDIFNEIRNPTHEDIEELEDHDREDERKDNIKKVIEEDQRHGFFEDILLNMNPTAMRKTSVTRIISPNGTPHPASRVQRGEVVDVETRIEDEAVTSQICVVVAICSHVQAVGIYIKTIYKVIYKPNHLAPRHHQGIYHALYFQICPNPMHAKIYYAVALLKKIAS